MPRNPKGMTNMSKYSTIIGMEVDAQFIEEDRTANMRITTKPNVKWLRVVYKGAAEFEYFLDGRTCRPTSRDFARDVLNQEIANAGTVQYGSVSE